LNVSDRAFGGGQLDVRDARQMPSAKSKVFGSDLAAKCACTAEFY
jgi:hypothetical protein